MTGAAKEAKGALAEVAPSFSTDIRILMARIFETTLVTLDDEGNRKLAGPVTIFQDNIWYVMEVGENTLFIAYGDTEKGAPRGISVAGTMQILKTAFWER